MSDNYNDDTFGDENDVVQESPKQLREAANRSGKYKARAELLERENAFLKAGINADDPRMSYFVKGYEGELDPQAIQKAALDAGFLQPAQQGAQQQNLRQTAEAQQRVAAASAGAVQEGGSPDGMLAELEAAMASGGIGAMLDVAQQHGFPVVR